MFEHLAIIAHIDNTLQRLYILNCTIGHDMSEKMHRISQPTVHRGVAERSFLVASRAINCPK